MPLCRVLWFFSINYLRKKKIAALPYAKKRLLPSVCGASRRRGCYLLVALGALPPGTAS